MEIVSPTMDDLRIRIARLEYENETLKRKHHDIEQAKELYLKIFEDFPALIWRAGLDKLCNHFNRTWLEFTGRTMEEEAGNGWTEGVHPDDFQFCLDTYVTKFDKREPFWMEYRLLNKHKEYRWIRDYGRPFYDLDGSFAGYIGSCYDVTEEKENQQKLYELNVAKDKFLSILAHDLLNPFNNILGTSELLASNFSSINPENGSKIANNIYISAKNTLELLQNLLEWGNFHLRNKPLNIRKVQLLALVQKCVDLLQPIANSKSIEIFTEIDTNAIVYADENMLQTVFRNLITNAIKFSYNSGHIVISAKPEKERMLVKVTDHGIGIDPSRAKKLFLLGENPSTKGTQNEKGTGLGLVLCREFIEKHEGSIWVESEPGKGCTIYFTLPAKSF